MKKKIIKKIIFFIISLLMLSSTLVFLLNTEQGLRFVFTVVSKIVPGKLVIKKINGRLLGPIDAKEIYYENKKIYVIVRNIRFDWKSKDLLWGKINVSAFYINDLTVNIKNTKTSDKNQLVLENIIAIIKKPPLPKYLKLEDVRLSNISWQQEGISAPIKIKSMVLQTQVVEKNITFLNYELNAEDTMILIQGSQEKEWNINWKLYSQNLKKIFPGMEGSLNCKGRIYGDYNTPQITTTIEGTRFKYNDFSFANLKGVFTIDLSAHESSQIELNINSPKINFISFDRLVLTCSILPVKTNKQSLAVEINLGNATMSFPVGKNSRSFKITKVDVKGKLSSEGLFTTSKIGLAQHEPINIELDLPKFKIQEPSFSKQSLDGRITWQTKNLAFFQNILSDIKDIQGTLDIRYDIDGTLQNPKIQGNMKLANASFQVPELKIKIRNCALNIHNENHKIEYQANMNSGKGGLNLSGETLLLPDGIDKAESKVFINGTDFLVMDTHEYMVIASPQLIFQTKNGTAKLTGKIFFPQATIKPVYLNRNSSLPTEIVYVKKEKTEKPFDLNLHTQVQIDLGDKTSISLMGLQGKLEGQLRLVDDPKKITTAYGTLQIKDGTYNIYGQQLQVTKGELHFFGGALTNPRVDIEAIRDFTTSGGYAFFRPSEKKLTVGVRMSGMLDNAKVDLFSIPSGLPKTDILSYLIIGQPSQKASENKARLLLQVASALNFKEVGRGGNLIDSIRKKFGFSEFGFVTETRFKKQQEIIPSKQTIETKPESTFATNTAFALGRFLTPNIYVGYSLGFLDLVNVFRVRYYLGKNWSIQSESSSIGNGIDLFYTIWRD